MNLQEVLSQHAQGFYDSVFNEYWNSASVMTGYIVHQDDAIGAINKRCFVQGACHAAVNSSINRANAVAVITMPDRTLVNNAGAVQFYDWLINKSFYADVFVCKDPILSLRHGFVKTMDVSAAKWLGAAQLCRLGTSEFKFYMHAVYDILASGLDIHPALLVVLATELKLVSDKKTIKATAHQRLGNIAQNFYCANSSHLPFVYLESIAALQDVCKDDPNKPIAVEYQATFRQSRWQNSSNLVASRLMKAWNGNTDNVLNTCLRNLTQGTPTLLFNLEPMVQEVPYLFLWEDAVKDLKDKVCQKFTNTTAGTALNLSSLEELTKAYKLGE
jgi:hypothetical protein